MKPKLLSRLFSLREEMKLLTREMNLASRQIHEECWQPDPELAYHFLMVSIRRMEAKKYIEMLEGEGFDRIFLTIHDGAYVIMRVVDAGVIHYYTEPEETQ